MKRCRARGQPYECILYVQACLRSQGVPELARTSRSTTLIDMRPNVKPDINPANKTSSVTTTTRVKNPVSQHSYLYSAAINFFFSFLYISNMMNSLKLKQYMLFILKTTKVVVNELILTHIRQRMAEWNRIRLFFNWNVWNFAFPPFSIYLFPKE